MGSKGYRKSGQHSGLGLAFRDFFVQTWYRVHQIDLKICACNSLGFRITGGFVWLCAGLGLESGMGLNPNSSKPWFDFMFHFLFHFISSTGVNNP